jgi:hypothetical protein
MMKKEYVPLYASHNFVEALMSMKHRIAQTLSDHIKYRTEIQISYLDFGDSNDTISFIYSNKLRELKNTYGDRYRDYVWNSKRSQMKIGKVIKMIYNNEFPINQPKNMPRKSTRDDIESFVNMYKSHIDKNDNLDRFEIVKGDHIRFWYDQENYSRFIREDTTLAKSCLRYKESGKFLELMVRNPKLVNMLILKDDANKLRGRALVWNLTEPAGRIFMDRIYTVNDSDVELYKTFAADNGWLYKSRQTFGFDHNIVDGKTGEEKRWDELLLKVQLHNKPQRYYPYLDTLCVYNHEEYSVCNNGNLLRKPPHYRLADYQGSYIDEADYREMVYSVIYGNEIPREDSEYATLDQSWVYSRDMAYIHNTNGETAYKNSDKVKKSLILGKTKYFLNDECVYSDYLGTWIYKESVREVYVDVDKNEKGLVHRKTLGKLFVNDGTGDYVLTIIPVAKREGGEFTNEEYTKYIKKILRNGRADMRHIMSGELFINFNRKISHDGLYKLKKSRYSGGLSDGYVTMGNGYDLFEQSPVDDNVMDDDIMIDEPNPTQEVRRSWRTTAIQSSPIPSIHRIERNDIIERISRSTEQSEEDLSETGEERPRREDLSEIVEERPRRTSQIFHTGRRRPNRTNEDREVFIPPPTRTQDDGENVIDSGEPRITATQVNSGYQSVRWTGDDGLVWENHQTIRQNVDIDHTNEESPEPRRRRRRRDTPEETESAVRENVNETNEETETTTNEAIPGVENERSAIRDELRGYIDRNYGGTGRYGFGSIGNWLDDD